MFRFILLLITGLFALLLALPGLPQISAAGEVSVSVSPDDRTITSGKSFTVDLVIDSGDYQVRGWVGSINFDQDKLVCNSLSEGTFLKDFGSTISIVEADIDNDGGKISNITYAVMGDTAGGASGQGTLCTLSFSAKKSVKGKTDISPVDFIIADENGETIPGIILDGDTIAISAPSSGGGGGGGGGGSSPAPTPTPSPTPTPTPELTPSQTEIPALTTQIVPSTTLSGETSTTPTLTETNTPVPAKTTETVIPETTSTPAPTGISDPSITPVQPSPAQPDKEAVSTNRWPIILGNIGGLIVLGLVLFFVITRTSRKSRK